MPLFDLQAAGLPDPLDPERTTSLITGDPRRVAQTIAGWTDPDAIAAFLVRAGIADAAHAMAYDGVTGASQKLADGWDEEGAFGWSIEQLTVGGTPPVPLTVVEWTDGVAQDEIQIVADEDDAYEFLDALRRVVKDETTLNEFWRKDVPIATGAASLTMQVFLTFQLEDGKVIRPERYATLDYEFATDLTVDGVRYDIDNGRYLADAAPAEVERLWDKINQIPQPHTLDLTGPVGDICAACGVTIWPWESMDVDGGGDLIHDSCPSPDMSEEDA